MPIARASQPTPITASAAAVDPTIAAPQATAGAHDRVNTSTITAPAPHSSGTSADTDGPGRFIGLTSRRVIDALTRSAVARAARIELAGRVRGDQRGHDRPFSATQPSRSASTASSVRDRTP